MVNYILVNCFEGDGSFSGFSYVTKKKWQTNINKFCLFYTYKYKN